MNLDWAVLVAAAAAMVVVGMKMFTRMRNLEKRLDGLIYTMRDFPPHQHFNGKTIYPRSPSWAERDNAE